MRQQFSKEWEKLLHAWSVRLVFLSFLAGAVITAALSDFTGYMAPFQGLSYWGNMSTMLFAFIVAGQVAGEYQNGRAAAAESRREQNFAAKVLGLFGLSAFLCLMYTALLSLICSVKNGMGSGYFSHYPLQVAVFLFCKILIYWVYIAVFLLIGVLVRRKFWTFVLSFVVQFLEISLYTRLELKGGISAAGPWTALMQFKTYMGRADFLCYDFYLLFVPGVYVGALALLMGYQVFRRGKLQTRTCRKSGGLFRKPGGPFTEHGEIAKGLIAVSVMALFCGQVRSYAEENSMSPDSQFVAETVGEMRLVYGDRNLDDRDAFVLFLMAEGFTGSQQEDFFRGVENMTSRLMSISPYDEFADVTKIYALGTISAEPGARGDTAVTWEQAKSDSRDTFFGASFWGAGQEWKLELSQEGFEKINDLKQQLLPAADLCGIVINSHVSRGTAYSNRPSGNTFLVTLNTGGLPHELGHAIAGLADEYDQEGYYNFYEAPNMTRETDPGKVAWSKYMGMDDISVYPCVYNGKWCHPSMTCIMRTPNIDRFCQVCEDALRENICKYCETGRLLFSSRGKRILESGTGTDMRDYFKVRKKYKTLENSQILEELLLLQYYDKDGKAIDGPPGRAGTYFVEARFPGYQTVNFAYEPCSLRVSYEIKTSPAKVFWFSVTPLFAGGLVWMIKRFTVTGLRRG